MFPSVWGDPKKCKPKTESKELTHSLIQIPKSFNRRSTYMGKAAAPGGGHPGRIHSPPRTGSLFKGVNNKPYGG